MPIVLEGASNLPLTSACSPWTTREAVRGDVAELIAAPVATVDLAIAWATDLLYDLSGQRWAGECADTVRPYGSHDCDHGFSFRLMTPDIASRGWRYGAGGAYGPGCSGVSEVDLGVYPLVSVQEVLLDGAIMDPAAYRVDDWRKLVRVDGSRWPCTQDMTRDPSTEPGTWQVTFTYGSPPPAGGQASAMLYARELAHSLLSTGKCRLPARTQQVSRQGVTIVAYPKTLIDGWMTGLPEVDSWLASVNPKKIVNRATIVSPDYPSGVRHTGS